MKLVITLSVLLATFVPSFAAADETCHETLVGAACVVEHDSSRFRHKSVYAYTYSGEFVAVAYNEGSGFFGNTMTVDAVADSSALGRVVFVVVAFNDAFPSDGNYEYKGVMVSTFDPAGAGPAAYAAAGATDSDGDGETDAGGVFYDLGLP